MESKRQVDQYDFLDEYMEWIIKRGDGYMNKEIAIAKFEDADDFDKFLEKHHPDCEPS